MKLISYLIVVKFMLSTFHTKSERYRVAAAAADVALAMAASVFYDDDAVEASSLISVYCHTPLLRRLSCSETL